LTLAKTDNNKDNYGAAIAHLASCEPDWATLIALIGPCEMSPSKDREPFHALLHAVAHQQLNGRAAQAIFNRFLTLYPDDDFPPPEKILATPDIALRACGFSLNRIATIRGIAEKTIDGIVPTRRKARLMSNEELIARLTTLHGIGRWTVEMLLMHTLGRLDVLPVDDFGVREGWRLVKGLAKQPTPKELAIIGQPWAPYRSVAAWYLWRAVDQYKLAMTKGNTLKGTSPVG
jgi:DNA-3-methyladenine glycosylase II